MLKAKEHELMLQSKHLFEDSQKVKLFKETENTNMKNIHDGYHSFDDLYMHRMILSAILFSTYKNYAWKSRKHSDGEIWEDLFITGVSIPGVGDYSYHYHEEFWDKFDVPEIEFAPEYDGHKPEDIDRLFKLLDLKSNMNGIQYVATDDWEGMYINGILVLENHRIDLSSALRVLGSIEVLGTLNFKEFYIDYDILETEYGSSFPNTFSTFDQQHLEGGNNLVWGY